ncbi:hypothetical protein BDQ17DRAFT_1369469 [Cyathus striatus]|nr:hypothetical protein BDQ17DRAFT_1369469 [Cyathus striatus]
MLSCVCLQVALFLYSYSAESCTTVVLKIHLQPCPNSNQSKSTQQVTSLILVLHAKALDDLHGNSMLHGNISCANIMVKKEGNLFALVGFDWAGLAEEKAYLPHLIEGV